MRGTVMKLATCAAIITAATDAAAWSATPTAGTVVLNGDGLSAGGRKAKFTATTTAEAITLVGAVLGAPIKQGSHGDCGQGDVIRYARFRGAFELSFVKGKLSGWTADGASPRTAKGIGVGMTLAMLRKAYPDVATDRGDEANGGLGPSFQRDGGPNGSLDGTRPGSKVTGLYAGATCLAGI